jgi:hypothetical protein
MMEEPRTGSLKSEIADNGKEVIVSNVRINTKCIKECLGKRGHEVNEENIGKVAEEMVLHMIISTNHEGDMDGYTDSSVIHAFSKGSDKVEVDGFRDVNEYSLNMSKKGINKAIEDGWELDDLENHLLTHDKNESDVYKYWENGDGLDDLNFYHYDLILHLIRNMK